MKEAITLYCDGDKLFFVQNQVDSPTIQQALTWLKYNERGEHD